MVLIGKTHPAIVIMNFVTAVFFLVVGAVLFYLMPGGDQFALPLFFLCSFIALVLPLTSFLTARSLAKDAHTRLASIAFVLNIIVAVFWTLATLLVLVGGRFNYGVLLVFIPFTLNIFWLSGFKQETER